MTKCFSLINKKVDNGIKFFYFYDMLFLECNVLNRVSSRNCLYKLFFSDFLNKKPSWFLHFKIDKTKNIVKFGVKLKFFVQKNLKKFTYNLCIYTLLVSTRYGPCLFGDIPRKPDTAGASLSNAPWVIRYELVGGSREQSHIIVSYHLHVAHAGAHRTPPRDPCSCAPWPWLSRPCAMRQ